MDDNKCEGSPCSICGGTLRYKISRHCVPCLVRTNKKSNRKKQDLKHYGVSVDNEKVARRRAAEELREQEDW